MIRSMTGYASVRETIDKATITVEIKSLNHRTQDIHFHCPRQFSMMEIPLRERIQGSIRRGRIEVYLRVQGSLTEKAMIRANPELAESVDQAMREIASHLNRDHEPSIEAILQTSGVIETEEQDMPTETVQTLITELVQRACDTLLDMKFKEGKRLHLELTTLLSKLSTLTKEIEGLRSNVMDEFREKILTRIEEWKEAIQLDPNRVVQEVAFYTDRSDIQEEVVRLLSHIEQFNQFLDENTEDDDYKAVGRRLDFLCQELFREANTIGSKSTAVEITRRALALKSTIEQIREQVQNIE